MEKRTKIIATIGPACEKFETLKKLAIAGVDIFRLNFSHGTHEWHGEIIKKLQRLNQKSEKNFAILLDTKGPEIRTGDLVAPIQLKKGEKITLTSNFIETGDTTKIAVNYDAFADDIDVGERILVDNGVMNLRVLSKSGRSVECEVLDGGTLESRRHLNLPGKDISLDSITKKDWADIEFGIKMGVDFIALSFVRRADEIREVRRFLAEKNSKIEIIAKIENLEATRHLATIAESADGMMVARGDLGAEIPFAQVPQMQQAIVDISAKFRKPVIVATHMLESMIDNPIPTRAETTDIATAVWQSADCVMLSGETAAGKFPEKSVLAMAKIARTTEEHQLKSWKFRDLPVSDDRIEFCKIASKIAEDLPEITAIVVITRSGHMASMLASFRPKVPILAFTNEPATRRKMQILWGTHPFRIEFSATPQKTILRARKKVLRELPEQKGKKYVLISDFLVDDEFVPTIQIREF